jgi:glycerate 2-kinase
MEADPISATISRAALVSVWRAVMARCDAATLVEHSLRAHPPPERVFLLALGKPAGAMAEGARRALGRRLVGGIVVGPPGTVAPAGLRARIGSHPLPGARSAIAGRALWEAAATLPQEVLPLVLVAGGGSALAVLPAEGLSLATKLAAQRALFRSGLPIQQINAIRAHLSRLKGGGLARALGVRRVRVEVLSDIGSGEIEQVSSGPCSADATTFADCLDAAHASAAPFPRGAMGFLEQGARGLRAETAKPGDPIFRHSTAHRLAGPLDLRDAAARLASAAGFRVVARKQPFSGDWRRVGDELRGWLAGPPPEKLTLWVAVGEAEVALSRSFGEGGRAQQLVLSLLPSLRGGRSALLIAGSDGRDGRSRFAGAAIDGRTSGRAASLGVDIEGALRRFHASLAVAQLGIGLPRTAARTNLTDLFLLARGPAQ